MIDVLAAVVDCTFLSQNLYGLSFIYSILTFHDLQLTLLKKRNPRV